VAVTEGDKTEAEIRLGVSVNTWGINDLVARVDAQTDADIDALVEVYLAEYDVVPELRPDGARHESLRYGAAIELGLRSILEEIGAGALPGPSEDQGALQPPPGLDVP